MSGQQWITVGRLDAAWFQASCSCGFRGTARAMARTAEDDAKHHGANSGHVWLVGGAA